MTLLVGLLSLLFAATTVHAEMNLKSAFPGVGINRETGAARLYLEKQSSPRAVFWFETVDSVTFRAYNAQPPNRCHWDLFRWAGEELHYLQTHDECDPQLTNEVTYDPPIIFFPAVWSENQPWSKKEASTVRYYEGGVLIAKGVNAYNNIIVGWGQMTPNTTGLEWRTDQVITWQFPASWQGVTRWREHWWFLPAIPIEGGGVASGLKRTVGGNLAHPVWDWDIWFDWWREGE